MDKLKFTEWDSRSEMLDKFRDKQLIILQSNVDGIRRHYELELPPEYSDIKVVVFSMGHAGPLAVWNYFQPKLILACDTSIYQIDLAAKTVEYSKKLNGVFYELLGVESTGACTVLHELGIVSIRPDGTIKWGVSTTGIVEDFEFDGADTICLTIMDEQSKTSRFKDRRGDELAIASSPHERSDMRNYELRCCHRNSIIRNSSCLRLETEAFHLFY